MSVAQTGKTMTVMEKVGPNIISHVSNSDITHPVIDLPSFFGINFSITKHVVMLWIASIILLLSIIIPVRIFLNKKTKIPKGWINALELIIKFIRDSIVRPNVGNKWVMTWTPVMLTFFFFILYANTLGMIPIFDILGLVNRFVLKVPYSDSTNFINGLLHGGVTATGNFNVTAGLATVTFFSIILAGTLAHGFIKHFKNLVPHGLPGQYILF